jgi:hypothetical protein
LSGVQGCSDGRKQLGAVISTHAEQKRLSTYTSVSGLSAFMSHVNARTCHVPAVSVTCGPCVVLSWTVDAAMSQTYVNLCKRVTYLILRGTTRRRAYEVRRRRHRPDSSLNLKITPCSCSHRLSLGYHLCGNSTKMRNVCHSSVPYICSTRIEGPVGRLVPVYSNSRK